MYWKTYNSQNLILPRPYRRCPTSVDLNLHSKIAIKFKLGLVRPSQLAELSRSQFDPELFSHGAHVKFFFVTFATKVP